MEPVMYEAAVTALRSWAASGREVWVSDDKIFLRTSQGFDYIRLPKDERIANEFIDIIYPAL